MWDRLRLFWIEVRSRLAGETPQALPPAAHPNDADIEFHTLSASEVSAQGSGQALVCPVTRRSLKEGNLLYRCQVCSTTYSAEGWEFLRKTDKGRCCGCRRQGTVFPTRGEKVGPSDGT